MARVTPRTWRRSSYSTSGENCVEVPALAPELERQEFGQVPWTKSTRSQQTTDQCVELASVRGYAAVRDSKDPEGPLLIITGQAWQRLSRQIKTGAFDQG
ncbi:DUF397 domain-containing protein [Actinomadura sp. GC306]|uniref:DUF397 domain-containing protein n=1 Tax=Actinomadura sp. GC306 TaxID=2530367 RepID=UPI00104B2896|nr:DUF397 domain-containing protein [Actinomadura sp. GC306]TDC69604.1 DUF397 domain-containing protein [Actinomadura sp. GC306]